MLALWTGLAVGLGATTAPLLIRDASTNEGDHVGWGLRAADRLAQNLADLGLPVGAEHAVRKALPGFDVVVGAARVRGEAADRITWTLRDGERGWSWSGAPDALETAAARAAAAVAGGRGLAVSPQARAALEGDLPPPVQRLLGRARRRALDGHGLQAALMFERASRVGDRFWYEPLREAVRAKRVANGARGSGDAELAKAATARAGVAARADDAEAEAAAWQSFLRHTPHRLRPWSVPWPIPEAAGLHPDREGFWVDDGTGWLRVAIPPALETPAPRRARGRILAAGPEFVVAAAGDQLRRLEGRRTRWAIASPIGTLDGAHLASGYLAVWNDAGGAWIDPALGRVRERFEGAVVAVGDGGLLLRRAGELRLLRSGQAVPAWSRDVAGDAALTAERVLVRANGRLSLLRVRNGQRVGDRLVVGDRRLLSASGRHAVFGGPRDYLVVDLLAGDAAPARPGPGRPTAAASRVHGVAVAFEGGDVFLAGPRGELHDRVILPRAPRALFTREDAGIVVAVEAFGLHAIADARADEATDVDAILALARLARDDARRADAIRLADWAARIDGGPIAEVEALRAELASDPARRRFAAAKRKAASDPTRSLSAFRGLGLAER